MTTTVPHTGAVLVMMAVWTSEDIGGGRACGKPPPYHCETQCINSQVAGTLLVVRLW